MRYVGKVYRPPSEANSYLLQATIGCSWNHCTYCEMYDDKPVFRVRPVEETLEDVRLARERYGPEVDKVFVMDGDALYLELGDWQTILGALNEAFPRLRQISCYAMATNVLAKSEAELTSLREWGLSLLYIGPESGDDVVLKRIAKGSTAEDHARASERVRAAGMRQSVIFLLGAGGLERSAEHAQASAALASAMDPEYLSALTLTIRPGMPIYKQQQRGRFELPDTMGLLSELRSFVDQARPTKALFRTNHASNHLPIAGTLPHDRAPLLELLDEALAGDRPLRPEWYRGM